MLMAAGPPSAPRVMRRIRNKLAKLYFTYVNNFFTQWFCFSIKELSLKVL